MSKPARFLLFLFIILLLVLKSFPPPVVLAQTSPNQMPDLLVDTLKAGPGAKLQVTLKNIGTGPLTKDYIAFGLVALDGTEQGTFDLRYPTQRIDGGIEAPGGRSVYLLAYDITQKVVVTCIVDVTKAIQELDENNNKLEQVVFPPESTATPSPKPTAKPTATPSPTPGPMPTPTPGPALPGAEVVFIYLAMTGTPQVTQLGADFAVITWETNRDSDSTVLYGQAAGKAMDIQAQGESGRNHQVTLRGLAPGTAYQYAALSADSSERRVRSTVLYFRTLESADSEKPSLSLNIAPPLSGRRALLEAAAADNKGISRVVFSIDGKEAGTDYTVPYRLEIDTLPLGDGIRRFSARAYDYAGNSVDTAADGEIRNRMDAELSPVQVRLISPAAGSAVTGDQQMCAEINHDLDFGIRSIEFLLDGRSLRLDLFDPPADIRPVLAPVFIAACPWNAADYVIGEHVALVRVEDEAGNWGSASCRFTIAAPPEPSVSVTLEAVNRRGTWFEALVNVQNNGDADASRVVLEMVCQNLQALPDVSVRSSPFIDYSPLALPVDIARVAGTVSSCRVTISLGTLRRGELRMLRIDAVPILRDPFDVYFEPSFSKDATLRFIVASDHYTLHPVLGGAISSFEFNAAAAASDYLIMTCPATILDTNPAADANALFVKMAELARARSGVLGDLSAFRTRWGASFVKLLTGAEGAWSAAMAPGWVGSGYLLIIGESVVVPNWYIEGVRLCDYPYANTQAGEAPELRVGRITGNSASQMAIPIQNSLDGVYSAERALVVSGPEETWEPFVMQTTNGMRAMEHIGLDVDIVHAEYWTFDYEMLAKALRNDDAARNRSELPGLAAYLLKKIGPPKGADPATDLSALSDRQLLVWLLWARNLLSLSDYPTSGNAMYHADTILDSWPDDLTISQIMWKVLEGMLTEEETSRLLTVQERAAWLLWEELEPRGPLTAARLGSASIGGTMRRIADMTLLEMLDQADVIINDFRLGLARERAGEIMTARPGRDGSYSPWEYIYCPDRYATEQARSAAIKQLAREGYDIYVWYGHGDPGGWGGVLTDWIGSGSEIEPISLGGRNPVVCTFSCLTGYYEESAQTASDRITVLNPNPSISERFMQNGAAVYMGATETMWSGITDNLLTGRFWNYFPGDGSVGDMLHDLKTDTIALGRDWFHFKYYYHLYGDPKYGIR